MSLWKPLVLLALSVAFAAALYYGIQWYFAGIRSAPAVRPPRPPAWAPPAAGTPRHPLWTSLHHLWGPDRDGRHAVLRALLALAPADLPHPARMPNTWPSHARARVRALLTRLHAGRPYRAVGLELRLAIDEAPISGEPGGVHVAFNCGSDGKRWATKIAPTLGRHLMIGCPGGRFLPAEETPSAMDETVAPTRRNTAPTRPRPDVVVPSHGLAAGVFDAPGRTMLVVAADLTDWPDAPARWGPGPHLVISNRLVVDVKPTTPSPDDRSSR